MRPRILSVLPKILAQLVYVCNSGTWELKAHRSEVQDNPLLHREYEVVLDYMRLCLLSLKKGVGSGAPWELFFKVTLFPGQLLFVPVAFF